MPPRRWAEAGVRVLRALAGHREHQLPSLALAGSSGLGNRLPRSSGGYLPVPPVRRGMTARGLTVPGGGWVAGAATRRATQRRNPATPGNAEFVRACDLPEATHTPMAWPVAPCFLPACRLPGEASPRACAKAQAAGLCRARRVGCRSLAGVGAGASVSVAGRRVLRPEKNNSFDDVAVARVSVGRGRAGSACASRPACIKHLARKAACISLCAGKRLWFCLS